MKALLEVSNLVLSNLDQVSDPLSLVSIRDSLKGTTVEHQRSVYDEAIAFHDTHKRFPDQMHLVSMFGTLMEPTSGKVSRDTIDSLVERLKHEAIQLQTSEAVAKGDLKKAESLLSGLGRKARRDEFTVDSALAAYKEMISRPAGILLGIPEIDEAIKGCCYGNMTVIAAPPGSFKTTTAISATYKAVVKDGFNFVFNSFELMERDVWFNFLSRHAAEMGMKIPAEKIKKGALTDEEFSNLELVAADWKVNSKGQLRILTTADFDEFKPAALNSVWNRIDEEMGQLDGMVVDYMQLLRFFRPPGAQVDEFLNDMVRYFTTLGVTFKGRGLIMFLLSQINREGEKKLAKTKKADKTSFAEINSLERDAHNAIVLYSDDAMRLSNTVMAQVVKNRSGRTMSEMVSVFVDPESFIVGSSDFSSIFSDATVEGLGSAVDDMFA